MLNNFTNGASLGLGEILKKYQKQNTGLNTTAEMQAFSNSANPQTGINTQAELDFRKRYPDYRSPATSGLEPVEDNERANYDYLSQSGINSQAELDRLKNSAQGESLAEAYKRLGTGDTSEEDKLLARQYLDKIKGQGVLASGYESIASGINTPAEREAIARTISQYSGDSSPYNEAISKLKASPYDEAMQKIKTPLSTAEVKALQEVANSSGFMRSRLKGVKARK